MPTEDFSRIRRELLQLRQDLENAKTGGPKNVFQSDAASGRKKSPLMDFGLFLLAYFFWLIVIVTAEVAAGLGIHEYTCFFAIPCAWLTLALIRRAPLYALMISVIGVAVLAGAAYFTSLFYDTAWDSNCYHKPITGMLLNGWNPFRQTFIDFANTRDILPYNSAWLSYQVNNQPKASFMIAASFYALLGGIEYGKVFNLVSMIACVCIAAPLLSDAFRLNRPAALLAMLLACANPITLSQIELYYNDGFTYQMLTAAAVSFAYILFKPKGALAPAAKLAAFMAVCIAVNVKTSAALYVFILSAVFIVARAVQIFTAKDGRARGGEILRMLSYFAAMAVCAVCVLGASTYVTNFIRYGNPFYGMLGENSMSTLLASLMGPDIHALPLAAQFFVSMFSPTSNVLFSGVNLKIPFTISREEWKLSTMDANVGGWGILFGGIFIASVLIVLVSAVRMHRRSPRAFWMLLGVLGTVILPVFVIPYLFSARYYLQPFWVPLAAFVCLFAPGVRLKKTGRLKFPALYLLKFTLAPVLCALLAINAYAGIRFLSGQYAASAATVEKIGGIKEQLKSGDAVTNVTTISRGLFYGLFFNLRDEGIKYNFCESLPYADGDLLYYLQYNIGERGPERDAEANAFLYSLYRNGYLVVIAANGGSPLAERMTAALRLSGLMLEETADPEAGYLAVINPQDGVVYEQAAYAQYQAEIDGIAVAARSTSTVLSVTVDGAEYAHNGNGFSVVVYDTKNRLMVSSVVIDTDADPVMTAFPLRVAGGIAR